MTLKWLGLAVLLCAAGAAASEGKDVFVSATHGISMEVPAFGDAENLQVAMFFLPASNAFSANVNVQKQRFPDTIEAYDNLSANQFGQFGLTIINRALKGNEVRYEYRGDMQGRPAHWYARGVKAGNYVYLITATGLEKEWKKQKAVLMKSVDSFVLVP